jgi:hypothetical protein
MCLRARRSISSVIVALTKTVCLSVRGTSEDALDVVAEADVEHPVDLVEHRDADVVEAEVPALDHVQHAPGGADDDLGPLREAVGLGLDLLPAVDGAGLQAR